MSAELAEIEKGPAIVEALHVVGRLQQRLGLLREAVRSYKKVLKITPDRINTLNNLAAALISCQKINAARKTLDNGWLLQSKKGIGADLKSWTLLMNTELQWNLHVQQFRTAHKLAKQLVPYDPTPRSLANLSVCLRWMGNEKEAVRAATNALARTSTKDTDRRLLELNLGTMQLTCNPHDQRGWRHLNARLSKGLSQSESQYLEEKLWKGAPCEELCLWDEQGYGDTIMALRWVPEALRRCDKGTLVVRKSLVRLLQKRLDLPNHCEILALEEISTTPWRYAKHHAPLMSLPGLLPKSETDTKPNYRYLRKGKSKARKQGIGIVWAAGEKENAEAERMRITRSIPVENVRELLQLSHGNQQWIALQLGEELKIALDYQKIQIPSTPKDWEETAALVEKMELVISVDTAMAHLAGALGVPTLLLLNHPCDWRWGQEPGSTVHWYYDMKILRCDQFNGWDTVCERVSQEVLKLGSI